jgi:hypothetical protein
MSELLPCPCCGGTADIDKQRGMAYSVGCEDCGLQTPYLFGIEQAVLAWNTRTKPAQIDERAEFEAWSLPRRDEQATRNTEYPDQYEDITMQIEWQAWQARSALGSHK